MKRAASNRIIAELSVERPRRAKVGQFNGKTAILDAAAKLFYQMGYAQASIRRIAAEAGIESASLYHHFSSKEEILFAVEQEAFQRLALQMERNLNGITEPWDRLVVACVTHVRGILENREYISVTTRELPHNQSAESRDKFLALRDDYEAIFRGLIAALPLNPAINRKYFRLGLIGALAEILVWYREGRDSPEKIASEILAAFRLPGDLAYCQKISAASAKAAVRRKQPPRKKLRHK